MTTLGFCDLGVRYGGTEAVRGFNDLLHAGEWLCLIGPNGAGKSSILRSIVGLADSSGDIEVNGRSIRGISSRDRARLVAYVPQRLPRRSRARRWGRRARTP